MGSPGHEQARVLRGGDHDVFDGAAVVEHVQMSPFGAAPSGPRYSRPRRVSWRWSAVEVDEQQREAR
jgi:hypothetical protein